jgi:hypothetical protein
VTFFEKIICSYKNIAITLHQFITLKKMSSLFNKVFMYKKFFYGIAVLGVAALAAWNVNVNSQKVELSDVMLANVEALAQDENGGTNVVCKCSRMQTQNCAVNNWGAQCASGNNVHCWEYNLNCN